MEKEKSIFQTLSAVNVNSFTEKKNNLTYLSWAHAWSETVKLYPDATYEVINFQHSDGTYKPYIYDNNLGYMVQTVVKINDLTIPMQLPVLDGANKAMKSVLYEYETKYGKKKVEAATMFDINTAIMRCLTKNLAMFGLGHYIYAGEDMPQFLYEEKGDVNISKAKEPANTASKTETKPVDDKLNEDKTKALEAFKSIDFAKVLALLVKEYKLTKYTKLEDFVKGEDIDMIREVYSKLTTK